VSHVRGLRNSRAARIAPTHWGSQATRRSSPRRENSTGIARRCSTGHRRLNGSVDTAEITRVKFTYRRGLAPEALAAEIRQLRELTPTFGIRGVRRSLIEAAERALEVDDPECRELAEQLLREVRKIPT